MAHSIIAQEIRQQIAPALDRMQEKIGTAVRKEVSRRRKRDRKRAVALLGLIVATVFGGSYLAALKAMQNGPIAVARHKAEEYRTQAKQAQVDAQAAANEINILRSKLIAALASTGATPLLGEAEAPRYDAKGVWKPSQDPNESGWVFADVIVPFGDRTFDQPPAMTEGVVEVQLEHAPSGPLNYLVARKAVTRTGVVYRVGRAKDLPLIQLRFHWAAFPVFFPTTAPTAGNATEARR